MAELTALTRTPRRDPVRSRMIIKLESGVQKQAGEGRRDLAVLESVIRATRALGANTYKSTPSKPRRTRGALSWRTASGTLTRGRHLSMPAHLNESRRHERAAGPTIRGERRSGYPTARPARHLHGEYYRHKSTPRRRPQHAGATRFGGGRAPVETTSAVPPGDALFERFMPTRLWNGALGAGQIISGRARRIDHITRALQFWARGWHPPRRQTRRRGQLKASRAAVGGVGGGGGGHKAGYGRTRPPC